MQIQKYKRQADYNDLDKEAQRKLLVKTKDGNEEAKDKLIKSCMSLGISIAAQYAQKENLEDAIQESYLGLVEAIDKYNLDFDVKFSTYAAYHAKYRVLQFVYTDNKITIPENVYKEAIKYKNEKKEIAKRLDRSPSTEDIINNSDYDYQDCLIYEKCLESILSYNFLMELTGNEAGYINNKYHLNLRKKNIISKVNKELEQLPELERRLLKDYYGIDNEENSLRELSQKYDYSHTHIKNKINHAVEYLKQSIKEG